MIDNPKSFSDSDVNDKDIPITADNILEVQTVGNRYRTQRKVTSYRLRKSAISSETLARFEQQWQKYGMTLQDCTIDSTVGWLIDWLVSNTPLVVDIGPGTGISAIEMAKAESHINIIAAEVYVPGLMKMAKAIEELSLENLRLYKGDAIDLLQECIPDGKLTGIRIFFPDPWPKKKHHKRRLLNRENIMLMLDKLSPRGVIHIATDHDGYAEFISQQINGLSGCSLAKSCADFGDSPISLQRPQTKFELRAHKEGREITEFYLHK